MSRRVRRVSGFKIKGIVIFICIVLFLCSAGMIVFLIQNAEKKAEQIYVDKINEGYSFKGIYKRGASEVNHICNKIYGIPNTPLLLSYEKFYILVEKEDKGFEFRKLRDINVFSFVKTILLIKNK